MKVRARAALAASIFLLAATSSPALADEAAGDGASRGGPSLKTELDLDIRYRVRSAEEYVEEKEIKSGIDLQRSFFEEPPMARASFELGAAGGLSVAGEVQLKRELAGDYGSDFFSDSNLPMLGGGGNPFAVENAFFTRGAVFWESPALDIVFGRDKVDYGGELKGSLYPSLRLPFLDALRAEGRIGSFGLDLMISTLHLAESFDGMDVDPNWGAPYEYGDPGTLAYYGFEDDDEPSIALELLHRLSWDFGSFRVGIAENCVLVRRNNRFLVTDFIPLVSWHQTSIVPNNVTILADIAWDPLPGLTIAAQGGFDDFNAESVGIADSSGVPTIGAFVLGAEYEADFRAGRLAAYAEAGYTHFLWGNFSAVGQISGADDVVPLARAQYRYLVDGGAALLPLTSPYGPGAVWLRLDGDWSVGRTGLSLGAELLLLGKDEKANLVSTIYEKDADVGRRSFFGSLSLPVAWRVGRFELYAIPEVLVRDGTWWLEAGIGVSYRYRGERNL